MVLLRFEAERFLAFDHEFREPAGVRYVCSIYRSVTLYQHHETIQPLDYAAFLRVLDPD